MYFNVFYFILSYAYPRTVGLNVIICWEDWLCRPKEETASPPLESTAAYNTNHCPNWSHLLLYEVCI